MPLFSRPDGDLVKGESLVRRMMPYLMRGRNESVVYHDALYDLTKTKPWLKAYGAAHPHPATLFHLFLYALGRVLHKRPGLNRFVSGSRIYQRRGVQVSFAAKKRWREDAPLVTVKMDLTEGEAFDAFVARVRDEVEVGRGDTVKAVDKELRLALALPGFLLRFAVAALRWLDRVNLMPAAMIRTDPLYASAFVANLGSLGIDNAVHHLYEYGTIGLFGVMGLPKKQPLAVDDRLELREAMAVRWSFDERVNDGFYCAAALKMVQRTLEDPERFLGDPQTLQKP